MQTQRFPVRFVLGSWQPVCPYNPMPLFSQRVSRVAAFLAAVSSAVLVVGADDLFGDLADQVGVSGLDRFGDLTGRLTNI